MQNVLPATNFPVDMFDHSNPPTPPHPTGTLFWDTFFTLFWDNFSWANLTRVVWSSIWDWASSPGGQPLESGGWKWRQSPEFISERKLTSKIVIKKCHQKLASKIRDSRQSSSRKENWLSLFLRGSCLSCLCLWLIPIGQVSSSFFCSNVSVHNCINDASHIAPEERD